MKIILENRDTLRKLNSDGDTVMDAKALELLRMTDRSKSVQEAIRRQHTDFLRNLTFSFHADLISEHAIDAVRRHYRVPAVITHSTDMPVVRPDSIANSKFADSYRELASILRDMHAKLMEAGVPEDDAGYILPGAIACNAKLTMNAAELLDFFSVECCSQAHWETRELADQMLSECRTVAPKIFETAGPPCVRHACLKECEACRRQEWDQD